MARLQGRVVGAWPGALSGNRKHQGLWTARQGSLKGTGLDAIQVRSQAWATAGPGQAAVSRVSLALLWGIPFEGHAIQEGDRLGASPHCTEGETEAREDAPASTPALMPPAIPTAPPGTQQRSNGLLQTRSAPPTPTAHLMKPRKRFLKKFFWFLIHIYKDDPCPVVQRFWSGSRSECLGLPADLGLWRAPVSWSPLDAVQGRSAGGGLDAGRVHAPVWREPKLPGLGWQVHCSQPSLPCGPRCEWGT